MRGILSVTTVTLDETIKTETIKTQITNKQTEVAGFQAML